MKAADKTGWKIKRSIVRHRGSAVMMAVDEKNRVLLVGSTGCPPISICGNCPRARSMRRDASQAAKRELIEETGLRAKKWKKLATFYPKPRLRGREDDDLSRDGTDRGRSAADGR